MRVAAVIVLGFVMMASLFVATPAEALGVNCGTAARTAVVYMTAGSGEAAGWTPDCVTLIASFGSPGSVAFTNLDGLFHTPVAAGCFSSFQVNAAQTKYLDTIRLVGGHPVIGWTPCDPDAKQARTGTFLPFKTEGPKLPVIEYDVDGPRTTTIHFICAFHGPVMHGKIVLRS